MTQRPPYDAPGTEHDKPTLWMMVKSVLAAGFGVQSSRNRERDFTKGSLPVFIVLGIIGTALFVLTVYSVVRVILHLAAG